ncbi:hypothetical protein [Pullulanibacillus pueri]|uniref:Uncharacterized protein n=1 Tax=Pullulanibacillus pueri TaxID=1437324 RepID=A0A8J2ZT71_9BACL|nr:hypothetical protein [Pullulanibacillus pueri]GGH77109.1 hypothetical protein GCM10007096_08520 [Pullulanibacillus pueri]
MSHQNHWNARYPKIELRSFDSNYLRKTHPLMALWWNMAMPGAGHLMIGKIDKGFFLFIWEFLFNTQANINTAIVYSCTGRFELAKATLDTRWFFLYIGVYVFTFWDAYRLATEMNNFARLSQKDHIPLAHFKLSVIDINYLLKVNKWIPVLWSAVVPGLGHIYLRHYMVGGILFSCFVMTTYQSRLLDGIYFTVLGDFGQATHLLDMEWLLYMPSLYCFSIYDSHYRAIELNKMYEAEQAHFLKNTYTSSQLHLF